MVSQAGKIALLWLFVAMIMASCGNTNDITIVDVPYRQWPSHIPVRATIINHDTLTLRELCVVVRHSSTLNENTIKLMVETTSPDGKYVVEVLPVRLTANTKANGEFLESEIPYRSRVVLSHKGRYQFAISHLSQQPIDGIQSIGIVVKR